MFMLFDPAGSVFSGAQADSSSDCTLSAARRLNVERYADAAFAGPRNDARAIVNPRVIRHTERFRGAIPGFKNGATVYTHGTQMSPFHLGGVTCLSSCECTDLGAM
jgi:hypothetical protein